MEIKCFLKVFFVVLVKIIDFIKFQSSGENPNSKSFISLIKISASAYGKMLQNAFGAPEALPSLKDLK